MLVIIKSVLLENRARSWVAKQTAERIYYKKSNPSPVEVEIAMAEAKRQYEGMGWSKCYTEPPTLITIPSG